MKRLGSVWSGGGRPPDGYFTGKTAKQALEAVLTNALRGQLPGAVTTGATFADAEAEWLRYVEHDRKRRPSTIHDYGNVVRNDLLPEFGERPLEEITLQRIEGFGARPVAEGRMIDRRINTLLVLLPWHLQAGAAGLRRAVRGPGDFLAHPLIAAGRRN